jgi:hypothetical protein
MTPGYVFSGYHGISSSVSKPGIVSMYRTLHEVKLLAPQALPRLLEAARGMTVVGEVLAGRPDLVANEDLVIDAQRRGEVADINLGHAIER